MALLEYTKWVQRQKQQRWEELRKVLRTPWTGDRGWEGRTIGLHLPLELRNFAIKIQERLGLKSMKEVLFKALVIGLRELDTLPANEPAQPTLVKRAASPVPIIKPNTVFDPFDGLDESGEVFEEEAAKDAG